MSPYKIEWHYDEKPPSEGCYLVAYTFQYMPRGATTKRTTFNTCEAVYENGVWLDIYREGERPDVYAWANLPPAPPLEK